MRSHPFETIRQTELGGGNDHRRFQQQTTGESLGQAGEAKLNERYFNQLPEGLELKIVNPSGMIIMGRDQNLTAEQRTDFEVIRRKYRHVVEIMTYDDLLRRLKVIQKQFLKETER